MTARRTARLALHWAVTTTVALAASTAGVLAAAAVCLIGLACAPHLGGAR